MRKSITREKLLEKVCIELEKFGSGFALIHVIMRELGLDSINAVQYPIMEAWFKFSTYRLREEMRPLSRKAQYDYKVTVMILFFESNCF